MILKIRRASMGSYAMQLKEILKSPALPVQHTQVKPEDPVTRKEFLDFIDELERGLFTDLAHDLGYINEELKRLGRKF